MLLLSIFLACGNSSDGCDSGVDVTYADFGETFIRQHCQGVMLHLPAIDTVHQSRFTLTALKTYGNGEMTFYV